MKNYSVEGLSRFRFLFFLAIFSSIISGYIFFLPINALSPFVSPPSAFAIFGVFLACYDKYLWRVPLFRNLSFIPCIDGNWTGVVKINEGDDLKEINVTVQISQTWSRINVRFVSEMTQSDCRNLSINLKNDRDVSFLWVYQVRPRDLSKVDGHGFGVTELRSESMVDISELQGSYFSTKMRGGSICLKKQQQNL